MKAILFDCDGVIADTNPAHARSWKLLADEHGLVFGPAEFRRMLGRTREDSLAILLAGRKIDPAAFNAMLARKQALFLTEFDRPEGVKILPGAAELIASAREEGLALALASSSRNGARVLARLGLTGQFDAVVDGNCDLPPKPAPDVFIEAARRLGIAHRDAIVIEDSAAGVEAARKGGFRVVSVGAERLSPSHLPGLADVTPAQIRQLAA